MENEIIEKVRNFVEEECRKPTSKYGYEPYVRHFLPVVKIAKELGKQRGGDLEIIEISALLHDIGSIVVGRENHHVTSGEIAERKLRELGYPEERIMWVRSCIFTHRGSKGMKPESIEGEILAEADAIDAFGRIEGLFWAAYQENLTQKEAIISVRNKLLNKYDQLSEDGRKMIQSKYDALMLILGD